MRPSWPTRPCATQDVAMNVKCEMSYWSRYPRSGCWGLIIAWNITDVFDGTWWSCHIRPAGLIDTQQTQVFIDTVGFCVRLSISRILTQQSSITRFSNGRTYTGRSRSSKAGPSLPNGKGKWIEYLLSSHMVGQHVSVALCLMDPAKWMGEGPTARDFSLTSIDAQCWCQFRPDLSTRTLLFFTDSMASISFNWSVDISPSEI